MITSNYIRGLGAAIVLATQFMGTAHASIGGHSVSALVPVPYSFEHCTSSHETGTNCTIVEGIDYFGTYATVGGTHQQDPYTFTATFTDSQIVIDNFTYSRSLQIQLRDLTTGKFIPVTFDASTSMLRPYGQEDIFYGTDYTGVWAEVGMGSRLVFNIKDVVSPVPEPSTAAMGLAGFALLGFMARRRNRQG